MADEIGTKVSQLPLGENLADDDLMYAVEGGISKKVEVSYLQNRIVGDVDSTPTASSDNLVTSGGVYNMVHTLDFNVFHDLAQISNSIADAFSASESYSEGDYVVYDYSLYKFTADKSAGAWDSSKATPVAVVEELGSGGTTVVPNPSGEATDTLEKLQIDQTIYDFATSNVYGEASGAIASFSDGSNNPLVKLEADINPIQDLHGYGKPWAGGAGKNKLENTATTTSRNGLDFTVYPDGSVLVNGTATASTDLVLNTNAVPTEGNYIISGCPEGGTNTTYWLNYKVTINGVSSWKQEYGSGRAENNATIQNVGVYIYNGAVINNLMFYPMIRLATETDATFAPYSNICPISGWSSVEVTRTGKNLLDGLSFAENIRDYGYNAILNTTDKYVRYTRGIINPDTGQYIQTLFEANFKTNVQYTVIFSYSNAGNNSSILLEYTDETRQQITLANSSNQKQVYAQTTSANKTLKRIVLSFYGDETTDLYYEESGLFEGVLTAQDFEPYVGTTETISLGQTIYGGVLNVTTGELTVDKAMVDMGTLNWTLESSVFRLATNIGAKITSNTSEVANMICSIYETVSQSTMGGSSDKCVAGLNWGYGVRVKDTSYSDASSFKSAMDGVQLVYEIATPTTVTLTPTQVSSLLGSNNIWADSGDVDVVYIRDLNLFLNQLDARVKALENA